LLSFVLSLIAGSLDITGFLGLGGLVRAHITGNVVALAAKLVADQPATVSYVISMPGRLGCPAASVLRSRSEQRLTRRKEHQIVRLTLAAQFPRRARGG